MGNTIWIWPSGDPAVFSTQSAVLRLTVASQLQWATPVYLGLTLFVAIRPSVNIKMFSLISKLSFEGHKLNLQTCMRV